MASEGLHAQSGHSFNIIFSGEICQQKKCVSANKNAGLTRFVYTVHRLKNRSEFRPCTLQIFDAQNFQKILWPSRNQDESLMKGASIDLGKSENILARRGAIRAPRHVVRDPVSGCRCWRRQASHTGDDHADSGRAAVLTKGGRFFFRITPSARHRVTLIPLFL